MTTSTMHMILLRITEYLFQNTLTMYNQPHKQMITVIDKGKPFREKLHAKRGKCIVNASQELKSTLKQ